MDKLSRFVRGLGATLLTWMMWLLGGWDAALTLMFTAMGLDYCTGVLTALLKRSNKTADGGFRSSAAFLGLTKKLLMLVIVALGTLVDRLTGAQGVCRLAAIGFYTANEGMSIIENAQALGVPFPRGLLALLERLRSRHDSGDADDS